MKPIPTVLGVSVILLLAACLNPAKPLTAQQDIESMFSIQGKYSSDIYEITVPDGWRGAEQQAQFKILAILPDEIIGELAANPSTPPAASIYILQQDKDSSVPKAGANQFLGNDCNVLSASIQAVNGAEARMMDVECPQVSTGSTTQNYAKAREYDFFVDSSGSATMVSVIFSATSSGAYDKYVGNFEEALVGCTRAIGIAMPTSSTSNHTNPLTEGSEDPSD